MSLVDGFKADLVHPVEDVEEVLLGVDCDLVDRGDYLADDPLAAVAPGRRAVPQIGQKLAVDEGEERPQRRTSIRSASSRPGPPSPASEGFQRRREPYPRADALLRLDLLALVQNPQEQDPRELRHVLEGAGVVRAPHDVRDLLDRGVHRRRSGEAAGGGREPNPTPASGGTIAYPNTSKVGRDPLDWTTPSWRRRRSAHSASVMTTASTSRPTPRSRLDRLGKQVALGRPDDQDVAVRVGLQAAVAYEPKRYTASGW